MQVSATATTRNKYTINIVITKSQVTMLAKKEATLIDKGIKSYSMNALMLSGRRSLDHGISKPGPNRETKKPYLLQIQL